MDKQRIRIETPLGTLVAYPSFNDEFPGIFIDLERNGVAMNVGLVEVDNSDWSEDKGSLISRIWGDAEYEDPTLRITHLGIEEYFGIFGNTKL